MKRLSIKQTVLAAALAVGTALAAVAADPITYTWTGASGDNANWSNPANWDQNNGKVPGTADWAIIPASEDGQPWQITIDKATAKPADFYAAGPTVFSGGFTLNAQVNGASGHGGVLSEGKMEVTGEKTAASLSGVTKTAPMNLASDASYLASEGGSITFGYLCFDASKDISFVASNQNSKVTLSTMWTNAGGTAQPNLNENNTGLFFGAYDGGLLTLSPAINFVTGNDPTFIADGGTIVAKSTQATTADAVLNVTSKNNGSITFGAIKGSPLITCTDDGTVVFGGGTGDPTINCVGAGSVVTNTGTLTGNATVTAKDGAFVKLNTVKGNAKIDMLTDNIAEAIDGAKYIAVVTPSTAHVAVAEKLKGVVKKDQVILIYPGGFGALEFKKVLGDECPLIIQTNNLPYDTRLNGPASIFCSGKSPVNVALFPGNADRKVLEDVMDISPYEKIYEDVLECDLSLVNPSVHSGPCLLNFGAIEQQDLRGKFCMYEHFTFGAAKVDWAIDKERKAVGAAFGYKLTPLEDFVQPRGEEVTWQDIYMKMHGEPALTPITGPDSIWNRYLTEDCPNGLVPWSEFGKIAGVATPCMDGVIAIYTQCHERDWRAEGIKPNRLGLDGMNVEQIKKFLKTGNK